jgi:type I restriction enzyme S subunit
MLKPKDPKMDAKYFHYLFRSILFQKSLIGVGNGILEHRMRVPMDKLGSHRLPLPPSKEQELISRYLDKKIEQIDSLIEKTQKKVEILKEQRRSMINQYVTKGLDRDVEMKDSGVEWIGEMPSHWVRGKLKHFTLLITDGAHISPDTSIPDKNFVSTVDIEEGQIDFESCLKTSSESYEYLVQAGCKPSTNDILFSKDGTIGKTSVVGLEDFVVASSLIIIRPNTNLVRPRFLDFVLQSHVVLDQIESMVKGAALRRLSLKNMNIIGILLPPIEEQERLEQILIERSEKQKKIKDLEETRIFLLKEYRQSLISSVVTGKVRVTEDMI